MGISAAVSFGVWPVAGDPTCDEFLLYATGRVDEEDDPVIRLDIGPLWIGHRFSRQGGCHFAILPGNSIELQPISRPLLA